MEPGGSRVLILGNPTTFPLALKCGRCRQPTKVTASLWNSLPRLTVAQLDALGHLEAVTKDWRGAGLDAHQAHDMISRGMWGPGDAWLRRQPKQDLTEAADRQ